MIWGPQAKGPYCTSAFLATTKLAPTWSLPTSLLFDGNTVSLPQRMTLGALLCSSELVSGSETVEQPS